MKHRIEWKPLLIALAIPLAVGGLAAWIGNDGMQAMQRLRQPPLAPPGWVFTVVWTVLYALMGVSSYRVYRADAEPGRRAALWIYGAQLVINFFWTIFYFVLGWRLFSFFWLLLIISLVAGMVYAFRRVDRLAGWLQTPYLAWLLFAAYLNLGTWMLN